MIPLCDVIPRRTRPYATLSVLAAHAAAFVAQRAASDLPSVAFDYGLIPADFRWTALATSLFVHDGIIHVGVNMLVLWLFGPTVEDRTGHARFLALYALCGFAASIAYAGLRAQSMLPLVGASGAVAGVLGAYALLYRQSRVLILVPLPGLPIVELPALLIAGFWLALQIVGGWFTGAAGGLAAGAATILLFRRRERMSVEWWN